MADETNLQEKVITSIQQQIENEDKPREYELGIRSAKNVKISYNYTLEDFYNDFKHFKNNANFIFWTSYDPQEEPSDERGNDFQRLKGNMEATDNRLWGNVNVLYATSYQD